MKTGILGAGNFSKKVFNLLKSMDGVELIGSFESIKLDDLPDFRNIDEMMGLCDVILILDPIAIDSAMLSEFAKLGKHIYIESPGLCSRPELRQLELLAYESGTILQIGLKQRFYNFYNDLEKYELVPRIIDSNRFIKFNKNSTQLSVVDDLMLHDIDVSLKLSNSEVKTVFATAVGVYYKDPDVVNARIEFYNGCVANLSASKISSKHKHETKFFQNNTYCSIDFVDQILHVQSNANPEKNNSTEHWGVKTSYSQSKDSDGYLSILEKELKSFYNCIEFQQEPNAGISQYLQLKSVTDRIKEQLERNFITNS
ncbi:hypothetical protein GYB22_12185 [bacterium]|nr:hypothetical protein [bacterium]